MPNLDYGIFDCDTHCYETRDAFTRYLPAAYQDRAIAPVRTIDNREVILAGGAFRSSAAAAARVAVQMSPLCRGERLVLSTCFTNGARSEAGDSRHTSKSSKSEARLLFDLLGWMTGEEFERRRTFRLRVCP